ncbi:MAG: hypothetical protein Q8928_06825 [Bacteroidota bacterium]|nr:hypothetical protein [Bacteroidota bacterium]
MKRLLYIIVVIVAIFASSCKKDLTSEDVSKITTYPAYTLTGGSFYTALVSNQQFVDPGVKAAIGTKQYPVKTEGTVNLSIPDLYILNYSTYSDEGFVWKAQRLVLITNSPITQNYTGKYSRSGTVASIDLKTAYLGYYSMTTVWSGTTIIPIEFVDLGGGDLKIVPGSTGYGRHEGTGKVQPNGDIWFTVTLLDQGPLTSVRKWTKS